MRPIQRQILTFGDSNTFGAAAVSQSPSHRMAPEVRWPGVMRQALGPAYGVIEEGLSGRTTDLDDFDDPSVTGANRNGLLYLPAALASHQPLDLVIVMLGTNDAKEEFGRSPDDIAGGMARIAHVVCGFKSRLGYPTPRLLIVCPPPIHPRVASGRFAAAFPYGVVKTQALADRYRRIAADTGSGFFDAGTMLVMDGIDGLHLTPEAHRRLGTALAAETLRNMPDTGAR